MERFYPDIKDRIISDFVGKYGERWDREEAWVLDKIREDMNASGYDIALDLGTGQGRHLPWLLKFNSKVIAIDLDASRIELAKGHFKAFSDKIEYITANVTKIPLEDKSASFGISSHLIQHSSTTEVPTILKEFRRVLKDDGKIIILTTHSPKEENLFQIVRANGTEYVSQSEFDKYVVNSQAGNLPVWKFDFHYLINLVEESGFKVLKVYFYHIHEDFESKYTISSLLDLDLNEAKTKTIDVALLLGAD